MCPGCPEETEQNYSVLHFHIVNIFVINIFELALGAYFDYFLPANMLQSAQNVHHPIRLSFPLQQSQQVH